MVEGLQEGAPSQQWSLSAAPSHVPPPFFFFFLLSSLHILFALHAAQRRKMRRQLEPSKGSVLEAFYLFLWALVSLLEPQRTPRQAAVSVVLQQEGKWGRRNC